MMRKILYTFVILALLVGFLPVAMPASAQPPPPGIAFVSDRDANLEIYAMNPDGTGQTRLTNNSVYDNMPVSSPDGTRIAFVSGRDGNREIYVMNANGTGVTQLTVTDNVTNVWPAWSPDGTKIAFSSDRDGDYGEIYTMSATDGSGLMQLTNNSTGATYPAWSPDGSKIAYVYHPGGGYGEIYVMDANGDNQTRLTNNPAPDNFPDWSPDGTKIAFSSNRDGNMEIYVMNADSTNQTNLTNNSAEDWQPQWRPDGAKITFSTDRDGHGEVYRMDANGANQTNLTNNPASDWLRGEWVHPVVTTGGASDVTSSSVVLSGSLTDKGSAGKVKVSFQWGLAADNYTEATPPVAMNATGPFSANLTGLSGNTTYHFRAKAGGDGRNLGADNSFTTSVVPPAPATAQPIAYWTFEGDNTNDSVGSNHGTIVGSGVTFTTGKVGRAISFSGRSLNMQISNQYVEIPSLNLPAITVEAWVNSSHFGYYTSMVTKSYYPDAWASPWNVWSLWFSENTANPGFSPFVASPDPASLGQWIHLAGTHDGVTAKLYVNGVEKASVPVTVPLPSTSGKIYIGPPKASNHGYQGLIDEVAIWDHALSAIDIQQHYQNGLNGQGYLTPAVTTGNAADITNSSAMLNGTLNSLGTAANVTVSFDWGLTADNYTASTPPVSMNITGAFSANLTSLSANTTYYFRAVAVGQGTGNGTEKSFKTANAVIVSDDFNDNTTDHSLWSALQGGLGPTVNETNQRLESTLPASSAQADGQNWFGAGYSSVFRLRGDFDIQVDYNLLVWPIGNGVRVALQTDVGQPERDSYGNPATDFPGQPREAYSTNFFLEGPQGIVATDNLSGKLRMVRFGSTATGYYFSSGNWVAIHTGPCATDDVYLRLAAWSHDNVFMDKDVKVAFENFVVNQGQPVFPPTVTTNTATSITSSSAILNGTLTSLGTAASANVSFEWGLSADNYTASTPPVSMNATGAFSANLTSLSANTTYYFQAKAAGDGINYGDDMSFTTLPEAPPPYVLDQSYEPSVINMSTGRLDKAQTFTVGMNGTLARVDVLINRYAEADLFFDVRPTINGFPVESDTDTLASVRIPGSQVPTTTGFFTIDLSSFNVSVTSGQVLAIVLRSDPDIMSYSWSGTGGDLIDEFPSGHHYLRHPPGWPRPTWYSDVPGNDLAFRTFVVPQSTTGSISGHVYQSDNTTPIAEAEVVAFDYAEVGPFFPLLVPPYTTVTDENGYYTLSLPAGDYRLLAFAEGYDRRYFPDTISLMEAEPVSVTPGQETSGIDFSLGPGGTISGTITNNVTGQPIAQVSVWAQEASEPPRFWGMTFTDESGNYKLIGLPYGSYLVLAPALLRVGSGDDSYIPELWQENTLAEADAFDPVLVAEGVNPTGINFTLEQGGTISGYVYQSDNTTPIAGAGVEVYDYSALPERWEFGGAAITDDLGYYQTLGLPAGDYDAVRAEAPGYLSEFYDNKYGWHQADPVSVTALGNTPNINFSLGIGGTITGQVTDNATGQPIAGVGVYAMDFATNEWMAGTNTDASGNYTLVVPTGSYKVGTTVKDTGLNYVDKFYNNRDRREEADPVSVTAPGNIPNINFSLELGGTISGTVLDENTGLPLDDASSGNISLSVGWHKFVYRQQEREGGQSSRAAFKAPGDTDWRWFSTSELEIRTSPDSGAESGILLVNKKSTWDKHPRNHIEMVACVDSDSTNESGWYGSSVVSIINQNENIHGNDDYFTSYYEGFFYVDTAGLWYFSTDSDDASEIVIDDQVVAYWYDGHGMANRWEHKVKINVQRYDTGEYIASNTGNADGSYAFVNLPSGNYTVQAEAPGYVREWFDNVYRKDEATPVPVTPSANTTGINFALGPGGTISGHAYRESDNVSIANLHIQAFDAITNEHFASTDTDTNGNYTLSVLPAGSYKVRTNAEHSGLNYIDEWYDNKPSRNEADPVSVTPLSDTPNIDFSLEKIGGTISGHVYQSDNATPIEGASIRVYDYDSISRKRVYYGGTTTGADGSYTTSGLPTGVFGIQVRADGYATEWYDNTHNRNEAAPVVVTAPDDTPNINFSLEIGGTISGYVYQLDGTTPIENAQIDVVDYYSMSGSWVWYDGTRTGIDGIYQVSGLPTGIYGIRVRADGYATEWYADTYYQNEATPVPVTAPADTPNINFSLGLGGSISGHVYQSDNTTPIANLHVYAVDNVTKQWMSGTDTDSSGNYTLHGFPSGGYLVSTSAKHSGLNYIDEWYNNVYHRDEATPVPVTVPDDTPGIDFSLEAIVPRATIEEAIADGIAWLAGQQNPDGSWGTMWPVAKTALAVLKLETHATSNGTSPLDPGYIYRDNVWNGLNYLFANAYTTNISPQPAGNPDSDGDGVGVYFYTANSSAVKHFVPIYETSIAMMAIAASNSPDIIVPAIPNGSGGTLAGWTYQQVLQDAVDYIAWAQTDRGFGRGGWNYGPMDNAGDRSDQSNAGWATLALAYAEAPSPIGFSLPIPGFVRTELDIWIDYIQDPVDGDKDDGGSWYTGPGDPNNKHWINILKTGNLLQQMAFVGDTENTTRVKAAIDYLARHWDDPQHIEGKQGPVGWQGFPSCYHSTYTVMKGLEAFNLDTLVASDNTTINWFQDFVDAILSEQTGGGWWPSSNFDDGERILSTEWALLTLQKTTAPTREAPDLVISEKHEEWVNEAAGTYKVYFTLQNKGNAVAPGNGYLVLITVDGVPQPSPLIDFDLAPGSTWNGTNNIVVTLSGGRDEITVYADASDNVTELNEDNNYLTNTWPPADWVFMVYMAADNDMEHLANQDINEMEMAGSTDNVTIRVLKDGPGYGDSQKYRIVHDEDMGKIASPVVNYLGEVNMGDPQTLVNFVVGTMQKHPAKRYALILWGGTAWMSAAWRGMGIDNHSGGDYLTIPEVRNALATILSETGVAPDLIGFDTSLMALAEVAYELAPALSGESIIVASQEFEQQEGWAYQPSLIALTANSTMTAPDLAQQIITDYVNFYNNRGWDRATLSAVAAGEVAALGTAIDNFAQAMMNSSEAANIRTARDEAEKFWGNSPGAPYVDLNDFAKRLKLLVTDAGVSGNATAVMQQVILAVVAEGHGSFHEPGARGISIYYPSSLNTYAAGYATGQAFTANTTWDEFLNWILVADTTPPAIPTLVSPGNGEPASAAPVLEWNRATDNASAVTYNLQASDNTSFSSPVVNETGFRVRGETQFYRVVPSLARAIYYWRVQAVDSANNTSDWSEVWSFEVRGPTPQWSYIFQPSINRMQFGQSVAVADLGVNTKGDESGSDLEIATGSDECGVYNPELDAWVKGAWRVFDSQGNVEWARDTQSDQSRSSAAIADLDGDGTLEIIGGTTSGETVEVLDRYGNFVWTFPTPPRPGNSMWHSSPAVADVNTSVNGLEVIIGNRPLHTLFAFDGDNSDGVDDGISASDINWGAIGEGTKPWEGTEGTDWDILWIFTADAQIISTPAVGDVDGDGQLEVVFATGGKIYCLNGADGSLEWSYQTGAGYIDSSVGLADFDDDGDLEVVIGAGDGKVYFINNNGDTVIDASEVTTFQTGGAVHSSPSTGDVDGDGSLEVIIGSTDGKIYSLAYDPATNSVTEEWHHTAGSAIYSSAALAKRNTGNWDIYTSILIARPGFQSIEELLSKPGGANIVLPFPDGSSHPYHQAAAVALDSYNRNYNAINIPRSETYEALQTGSIDAVVLADLKHPSPLAEQLVSELGGSILPWSSPAIAAVTSQFSRAVAAELPANTYTGQTQAIAGYALRHWLDVYVGAEDGWLRVLDGASGAWLRGFFVGAPVRSSPSVADIDGDGVLEVVFADWSPIPPQSTYRAASSPLSWYEGSGDILWVYKDRTSDVGYYATEWPMFRNSIDRTGRYVSAVQVSINSPARVPTDYDFTVTVDISQVENLDAANYDVSFDPSVLRLDNVTSGDIGGVTVPVEVWNQREPGRFTVVLNIPGLAGASGSGYLAVLHFHAIGPIGSSSNISLSDGTLSSYLAIEIPATWTGGSVEISVIPGDANGDGEVNAIDITKVERIIAELDAPTPGADANLDGNINAIDITKVERIIVGLD